MPRPRRQPLRREEVIRVLDEVERRGLRPRHLDYLFERAIDESFQGPDEAIEFIVETFGPDETIRMIREMARRLT